MHWTEGLDSSALTCVEITPRPSVNASVLSTKHMSNNERRKRHKLLDARLRETRRHATAIPDTGRTKLPKDTKRLFDFILKPKKLTTPEAVDANVTSFIRQINPATSSHFLTCQPERWARLNCCDLNVMEYIRLHGGQMVFGYRIWYHRPYYIEGEPHAVWADENGQLRDVSFSDDGEKRILFVPCHETKNTFITNSRKIRKSFHPDVDIVANLLEHQDSLTQREVMDKNECWKTMLTYNEYLQGIRKPKLWLNGKPIA